MTDMYSIGIIIYEIYSRKSPYEGEDFRDTIRKICDRRVNKRPPTPEMCPSKMSDLMKKCWSPDPEFRPKAKDLDLLLMDMNSRDAEPLEPEDNKEKQPRTGDMLYQLFPSKVADVLKRGEKVEPETHENVTVIFSETMNFNEMTRSVTPLKISQMLDRLYLALDKVASQHHVFKVETVGDAYMGVTNLENDQDDTHVKNAAEFAMAMVREASTILIDPENPQLGCINIRVGFHSGPVVSNVIGSLNPRYGLFGDTVNTASRMGTLCLCSNR
uniref:guanylate cyclase n=1 Tax=Amphora coffeiformis TaxID=265554 RepID=A0A7S3L2A5_9STRA